MSSDVPEGIPGNHQIRETTSHDALTRFQIDLLAQIGVSEPAVGLDIKRDLEEYYGEAINHGRLYPNLESLREAVLIEKRAGPDKRSNHYALTEEGRTVLTTRQAWLTDRLEEVTD